MDFFEIRKIIRLKQEGGYWDFKREWYSQDKKADLLHDIICMANNLENRDAYIIIGVDEENDYSLVDVTTDVNRKNTQKMVDFLRDKKFAGGVRPIVYVQEVKLSGRAIDVIVIKNSYETPFYLTDNFQGVMANNIYTRIMDSNTPKNKSADIFHIEYLWKKRFRLITTPLERMKYYLQSKEDWENSPTNWESEKKYNKYYPEFTIEYTLDDDGNGYQYYLFNQTDSRPHWRKIRLYYHQTMLEEIEGVSLDGGRYFTPTPLTEGISLTKYHHWDIVYKYFIAGTLRYTIYEFYYEPDGDEETHAHRCFEECVLIFSSEREKEEFNKYVVKHWNKKDNFSYGIHIPYMPPIEGYIMEEFEKEYRNVQILKNMLEKFRLENEMEEDRGRYNQ